MSKLESGHMNFNIEHIFVLCEAYEVDLSAVINDLVETIKILEKNKVYVLNCNSSLKSLDEFGKEKEGKRINPKDNSAYKEFTHRAYVWDFNSALERNRFIEENKIKIWNREVAIGNQKYVFEHSDDADDFASSTLTAAEYLGIDKYDPYSKLSKEDQAKL